MENGGTISQIGNMVLRGGDERNWERDVIISQREETAGHVDSLARSVDQGCF